MKELMSIRATQTTYRVIIVCLSVALIVITLGSIYYANETIQAGKRNIYVKTDNNNIQEYILTDINNSAGILMKSQVDEIMKLIYQHIPDSDNMNKQLNRAVSLSDVSVVRVIDALKENDYYTSLLNQNFYSQLLTDSILVGNKDGKNIFEYYGKLKMTRGNNSYFRQIVSKGTMEYMGSISETNQRGTLIRDLKIVQDNPIE
ncbi:hypothetical protein NWE55_16905 (plasmid) [Myroides albus]|uniref:Conjugal transfer protein TraK n=1 Tax=Myroides odoratimimus TaxID=76832 RepID=A0AAI8C899_9FLAO|nr:MULTISPECIES: hypothetical protein [Myroides]ALU28433.1 hypothetical protein AS202_19830 [Myroides odoratimimus]ALU28503.1 hypothetical protein AS202_20200 [Myroides odoratimimus]UVD81352.1 hypothetical protein NWE55_16905 [Myroides albus]